MKLLLVGHSELYPVEQLQMQLFPAEPSELCEKPFSGDGAVSCLHTGKAYLTATAKITHRGKTAYAARRVKKEKADTRLTRRALQQAYYLAAVKLLGAAPPWGALAGVRPTKISTDFLSSGGTEKACDRMLRDTYFVSPARRKLAIDCSEHTLACKQNLKPNDLSLYIGIPFCPTRCAYCSFVSQSIEKHGGLVAPYLEALCREVELTGRLLSESGYRLHTLYIGGGTPTTLNHAQLERLMQTVKRSFPLSSCAEYTVEGGRPDTLDAEKFRILKKYGVSRVSINPQTMNDSVLEKIGRKHSAGEVLQAYKDAQDAGFTEINMDLIAGLPGDDPASFARSLKKVIALAPSNITVHTLALKKGADLFWAREDLPDGNAVAEMLDTASELLRGAGYEPYYLYRQKYSSGSFENVGWCKKGSACVYNICMMEELHSILALGGGGMNKVNFAKNDLERFHNPKYPVEYIDRIENTLEKKKEIFRLLRQIREDTSCKQKG